MRVLVIDTEMMGLDFVLRCSAADHDIRWFYDRDKRERVGLAGKRTGEGFRGFEMVDDWRPHMKWAKDGLILNTGNCKYLHELDRYRELGYKIFAPTVASAKLEIERESGMNAMKEAGIEVPPYETFDSLQAAAKFARKADKPYVFKPMGDEEDKSLTYVSCDPADLVGWIEQKISRGTKMRGACMLQEKIDMLCELGVSGWFGPDGFLPNKWQVCVEHKKLMSGENGPATGEQGTVSQYCESDKLANDVLIPLVGKLRKLGHRGDFAVGVGIDTAGKAWPFEFTSRFGYPAWWLQIASHKGDPAQWMRDLLDGKDTLNVSNDVAIGVVLAQPRYPYSDSPAELVEGNPIDGLEEVMDDVHLASVMKGTGPVMKGGKIVEAPIFMTTGEYVMVATALGKSVESARKKIYKVVDQIKFKDKMFRDDIGEKVIEALPKLHKFGYALDLS